MFTKVPGRRERSATTSSSTTAISSSSPSSSTAPMPSSTRQSLGQCGNKRDSSFTAECEFVHQGGPGPDARHSQCQKNPGHAAFLSLPDIARENLPTKCQAQEKHLDMIRNYFDRTVKVIVNFTSPSRPDTWPGTDKVYPNANLKGSYNAQRVGTGFIEQCREVQQGICPCGICEEEGENSGVKSFMEVDVSTATHVVYGDLEAKSAIFECFYDSPNRSGVKCLIGVRTEDDEGTNELENCRRDRSFIKCVTHDTQLMRKLKDVIQPLGFCRRDGLPPHSFIVSHPHGGPKKVTIGTVSHHVVKEKDMFPSDISHDFKTLARYYQSYISSWLIPIILNQSNDSHRQNSYVTVNDASTSSSHGNTNCSCNKPCSDGGCEKFFLDNITLGDEHLIQETAFFTLPKDANHLFCINNGDEERLSFPPGTIIRLADGRRLPCKTEFRLMSNLISLPYLKGRCLSYDIPTCPGSSGALVVNGRGDFYRDSVLYGLGFNHAGACQNGTNQSSRQI